MNSSIRSAAIRPWHVAAIAAVGALAVGIGVAAGSFLIAGRAVLGGGASYVPASAPLYVEVRVGPTASQDQALRELLARFGPIDGLDTDRPLHDQLVEHLDEMLASEDVDLTWANDIAPWFDGHLAVAVTEVPADLALAPALGAVPATPPTVVLLGVTDAQAAEAAIGRIVAAADAPDFTETEHAGVTVHVADGSTAGAYALASDQLIIGSDEAAVVGALDAHADAAGTLARRDGLSDMVGQLPSDWLAFATYDMTGLVRDAFDAVAEEDSAVAEAVRSIVDQQSLRGAVAFSAAGDRLAIESAADAPSGPFALDNADRGLAAEVPGDALYYAEAVNLGAALAGFIEPIKTAAAESPEIADQIEMAEAALGAPLEDLVSWIDDAAFVAGMDDAAPYAGLVIVPTDMDAAERRLSQLKTFAALGGMDPSSGISVSDEEVDGVTVTTLRFRPPTTDLPGVGIGVPTDVAVEWALTDDRVLIGIGEAFVRRALSLSDGDSLATEPRYADAVAELGGSSNAGVTWIDIAGLADTIGSLAGQMAPDAAVDELGVLDRFVSVTRVNGDLVVQRAALLAD